MSDQLVVVSEFSPSPILGLVHSGPAPVLELASTPNYSVSHKETGLTEHYEPTSCRLHLVGALLGFCTVCRNAQSYML